MSDRISLGVMLPLGITSGDELREWVAVVEECGVESVWAVEHVVIADDYDSKYPYSESGEIPGGKGAAMGSLRCPTRSTRSRTSPHCRRR